MFTTFAGTFYNCILDVIEIHIDVDIVDF